MKTAISMPDETFQRAEREAKKHGMSRSEFFTKAAVRYLDELETESLTHLIDQVIDTQVQSDDSTLDAVNVGHRLLAGMDEDW
ncbi:MAG: antitoxin [Acidimicrobiaceae bacterium]|nr:antitoxin [Acidimicrobiaceae bacterium]